MAAPAIGIDLGTTYSCVAVHRDGKSEVIANPLGKRITPSMVAFGKERLIGDAAKDQQDRNERNTVYGVKRLIGRKWEEPTVQQDIAQWPFKVINEGGRPKIAVTHKGTERTFYPEEISSMVLSYMKTTAEKYLSKTVRNALVTVPAYFNDSQRQATKDAAAIAGLNVLRIINEPTAAALAYGLGEQQEDERTVLIFDFGGGTFDVSILVIEEGIFEVRSTAGDTHLGGEDLDVALAIHFAEEFKTQHGIDVKGDKDAMSRLRRASERAKCALSAVTETRVELDSLHRGVDFRSTITRARFEQVCGGLLRNTLEPVRRALNDANMTVKKINEIVLVGGSTRIPMVQELLKEFFEGRELAQTVNPDEAVAIGAAVQAAVLGGDPSQTVTDLVLLDVTPLSLGTTVVGDIMSVIIKRNTTIPCKRTSSYTTFYDYQTAVKFEVREGERKMGRDNHLLGEFTLSGIRSAPAGVPKMKVTFELDADGILHASAVEESSNVSNQITIINDKGRLSPEEIARLVREAEQFKQEDELKKEASEARNDLEKYCYMLQNGLRENSTLSSSIHQTITSKCEETLRWIRDNPNASVDDYKRKRRDLELLRDLVFMEL